MSFVVKTLSIAGWAWTGAFFVVVIPLLRLKRRGGGDEAQRGFEVIATTGAAETRARPTH